MINQQAKIGVKEIVLAVNYQPEIMVTAMNEVEEKYGIKIHFSIEDEPLGTGSLLLIIQLDHFHQLEIFWVEMILHFLY